MVVRAPEGDSPYWIEMDLAAGTSFPRGTPPTPEVSGRPIPWTPRDVLTGIALFVGVFIIVPLPIALPLTLFFNQNSRVVLGAGILLSVPVYLCILWITARMTFLKYGGGWERLGVVRPSWATLGWGAVALIAAFMVTAIYGGLINYFNINALKQSCGDQIPDNIRSSVLLMAMSGVVAAIFAPVCEELFFRGFLFPGLGRAWGPVAGIVGSGILFGSAHLLGNPALYKSMIEFSAIGMVFAFVYWRSGVIFSSMLAHFSFNLIGIITIAATTCHN